MRLFYTEYEGGQWLPWPEDKERPKLYQILRFTGAGGTVTVDGVTFHSLLYMERWDTVNGWTPEVIPGPDIIEPK